MSVRRGILLIAASLLSVGLFTLGGSKGPGGDVPVLATLHALPAERVETHRLRRGETISELLDRAAIGGRELTGLLGTLSEYRDPRHLREGLEVTVRRWTGTERPRAVEVRLNADSTLRLLRAGAEAWEPDIIVTPTIIDTIYTSGVIGSGHSLYHAILGDESLDLPPVERIALVSALAEIYVYRMDFTRDIQPGDSYRLVYEREVRPDGTSRARRVLVAELENRGKIYPAIYFKDDEVSGYFDESGASLRTAFRRYPLDYVRITSAFSWRRYHPVLGVYRGHLGTDFGAPTGTPIKAAGDGVVAFAGRRGGYGNVVELRHPGGYTTLYAHMSRFARGISAGTRVEQGQVIGYVGATGLATGPHVHYELRKDGQPLDARTAELPPGAPPITEEQRPAFDSVVVERRALLARVATPGPRLAELRPSASLAEGDIR